MSPATALVLRRARIETTRDAARTTPRFWAPPLALAMRRMEGEIPGALICRSSPRRRFAAGELGGEAAKFVPNQRQLALRPNRSFDLQVIETLKNARAGTPVAGRGVSGPTQLPGPTNER